MTANINGLTLENGYEEFSSGGAIINFGSLAVSDCAFVGNKARYGGAILTEETLTVERCLFTSNKAEYGGGVDSSTADYTGGPDPTSRTHIRNSTFVGNVATVEGGGIRNDNGLMVLDSCSVAGNTAPNNRSGGVKSSGNGMSKTRVGNSIIVGNFQTNGSDGTDVDSNRFVMPYASQGFNIIGDGSGSALFNTLTDTRGATVATAGLDPAGLKNNGGPTQTIALLPNSPAIDAGSNALAAGITTDQRGAGFARIKGGTVDIGAFEAPDKTAPTVTITTPVDKTIVKTLSPISGTASDNDGVARVDLYLQRQSDLKFWNGTAWAPFSGASTLSTVLTTTQTGVSWTRSSGLPTGPDLLSGPYFIAARAVDAAGNGTSTSAIVNVDVLAPVIVIGSPAASAAVATTPVINGIASDTQGGSGLDRVTLVLRRNGVGDYWNGTNWAGTTPVAFNATLTGTSWKRDGGLPVIATSDPTKKLTDGSYTVTAVAYDRAGNLSPFVSANFTVDTKKPVVAISTPANNANVSTLPSVSGTASDVANGSGVATVALYLQRKSDNKYWNGTSWVVPVSALTTTISGTTWTRNSGLPSGADLSIGNYFLAARATDRAGNGESATSNFRVVAGSSVAQTTASTVTLSSVVASSDGTIRLIFTGALDASAVDAANYSATNKGVAIKVQSATQPSASEVVLSAPGLSSGARVAMSYDLKDEQGRSIAGTATVTVK